MVSTSTSDNYLAKGRKPLMRQVKIRIGLMLALLCILLVSRSNPFKIKFLTSIASMNTPEKEWLTEAVQRKTIPVTIVANGTIKAERSINLSPKSSGIIKTLEIEEGDRIRKGQLIAKMDDSSLQGQLIQARGQMAQNEANLQRLIAGNRPEDIAKAEAQLQEARANLQQLRSGNRPQEIAQFSARLQQAQATLRQRNEELQRHQQLYQEGAISQQALALKRMDYEVAQQQVREAEQALALQKAGTRPEQIAQAESRVQQQAQVVALLKAGNRREDIAQAQAQVESARGSLQTIEAQIRDTNVVAPFDGVVIKKYADIGAFVSPSMAGGGGDSASSSSILTLASDRNYVEVNLSESQIAKIRPGQKVSLKVDAFPAESFTGLVDRIAPQASISQNVTSIEVKVSLSYPQAAKLKSGMNVEAEFAVGSLENTLLVPNAAVVREDERQGVYVLGSDGQPVFKAIETGITMDGKTEAKSGLKGSEQVLVSPPSKPKKSGGIGFPPKSEP